MTDNPTITEQNETGADKLVIDGLVKKSKLNQQKGELFLKYLETNKLVLDDLLLAPENTLASLLALSELQLNPAEQIHIAVAIKLSKGTNNHLSVVKSKHREKTKSRKVDDPTPKKKGKKNADEVFNIPKRRMSEKYEKLTKVGSGGFSEVWKAQNKDTSEIVAVKMVQKSKLKEVDINREIQLMQRLRHPHIVQLKDVFEDKDTIYLVLEYISGGELFEQIVSRGNYTEEDAANVIRQILDAVAYMHKNGIAHRDLKPENLLVGGTNNSTIKLIDFGLSKDYTGESDLVTVVGTVDYVAPEVLNDKEENTYTNAVDVWSIGVITYILLCGYPPFYGETDQAVFLNILSGKFRFNSPEWDGISDEAKEFIKSILVMDPDRRPTAEELLQHPWLKNKAPSTPLKTIVSFKRTLSQEQKRRKRPAKKK